MTAAQMEAVESDVPDVYDGSRDVVADVAQSRILRRIFEEDGGSDTPVSAFNSSI